MSEQSVWKQIIGFFGFTDDEQLDDYDEYTEEAIAENPDKINSANGKKEDKRVIKLSRTRDVKMVVHSPESFDDVREIVDDLKNSRAVILNLEERDRVLARRFIDFLSGSVYALNGSTQKIGTGVFIFTPPGIDVDARAIENAIKNEFATE
ncbi:MAG: cell division protein SepF [Bacillota bacterium]